MGSCPRCKSHYSDDRAVCPRDGARLVSEAVFAEPTESAVAPGGVDVAPAGLGAGPVPPPIPETEDIDPHSGDMAAPWPHGTGSPAPRQATVAERPSRRREPGRNEGPRRRKPQNTRPEERLGQVLGSYRLLSILGRGGMGCVYLAEHVKLGRKVALKLLREDYARRRDAVSRFFQEARAVNRIRHRNIVDVTDFVELEDGTTFIIMELLDGTSLGKLARAGALSAPRALALLIQICDGLSAAHGVGIVHRDLKPDNIVAVETSDGADLVKLLDFGVAKLLYREEEPEYGLETAAGSVIGTPAYMSPEQAGGLTVDERSDIYSLGAIMYELFTGEPMFRARSFGEYVRKHLNEHPVAPRQTPGGAQLDERIEAIVLCCIQKRADDRYRTVDDLRADLLTVLGAIDTNIESIADIAADPGASGVPPRPPSAVGARSRPGHATVDRTGPASPVALHDTGPADTAMSFGDVPATRMSRPAPRWLPWLALATVVAVAGGGIALYARGDDAASPAPAPMASRLADEGPRADEPAPVVTSVPAVDTTRGVSASAFVVRFDATPRGEVHPAGAEVPLCTTPCDVTVDPDDGGPRRRDFVISREGYRDEAVTIDVTAPRDVVERRLRRIGPVAGARSRGDRRADPARAAGRRRAPGDDDTSAPDEPTTAPPDPAPTTTEDPPGAGPEPTPERPIDPEDTIDPFGGR